MTYDELTKKLQLSGVFDASEIYDVVNACGTPSIGNAVIAAEILGLELRGCDVDAMYAV